MGIIGHGFNARFIEVLAIYSAIFPVATVAEQWNIVRFGLGVAR